MNTSKSKLVCKKVFLIIVLLSSCNSKAKSSCTPSKTHDAYKSDVTNQWVQEYIGIKKKDLTIIVYIAADNDLKRFAGKNIKQMASIGSNQHINIAVQLNIRTADNEKTTKRYVVLQDKIIQTNQDDPESQCMDCGDPETLISCCEWAIKTLPAQEYALILWDHGTGIIDPRNGRIISSSDLFTFNVQTNKYELNRSTSYLDMIEKESWYYRGICWDDTTGNYLTNQDLEYALKAISQKLLQGSKLAILGFDACLMSMVEIANLARRYVKVMVGSQEVILGPGWNYKYVLAPFKKKALNYHEFAKKIVEAYQQMYQSITDDYTLAAINLEQFDALEKNIGQIAQLLMQSVQYQTNGSVKQAIYASKDKSLCTHFDEPSYIDLGHFLLNLEKNIKRFTLKSIKEEITIKKELKKQIQKGLELIQHIVFANITGSNLMNASGLSIYFPERKIHPSYSKTPFANTSGWLSFLQSYHHS